MITRGLPYTDRFDFKTDSGQPAAIGNRKFEIILRRNMFIRKIDETSGLSYEQNAVVFTIPGSVTSKMKFNKITYTLNEITDDSVEEIYSGVLDIN